MAVNYLSSSGLSYFWTKIKAYIATTIGTLVSNVGYDTTNHKLTKTIGSTTSDVATSATITKDGGAVLGVTMNNTPLTLDANNIIDLGTVITAHQDISGKADKTTTINGHDLSTNITLTASDISLGNVTNDAQVKRTEMGAANGVAPLNASGLIDTQYLPSYVDDVIEVYPIAGATELDTAWLSDTAAGTAITPEAGKIYILMADSTTYSANSQFRWGGTAYVKLADGGVSAITNAEIDTIMAS